MELKQMSWATFVRWLAVHRHWHWHRHWVNYAAVRQAKIGQATRNLCQCALPAPAHTENVQ